MYHNHEIQYLNWTAVKEKQPVHIQLITWICMNTVFIVHIHQLSHNLRKYLGWLVWFKVT